MSAFEALHENRETLEEQRDRARRVAEYANRQVEIYEDALGQIYKLASEFGFEEEGQTQPPRPGRRGRPAKSQKSSQKPAPTNGRRGRKKEPGEVLSGVKIANASNKSEAIKILLRKYPDARPKDVIATCEAAGMSVTAGLVSSIKTKLREEEGVSNDETKRGRKSLPEIVQGVLAKAKDGLKLEDLVDECLRAGYNYTGDKEEGSSEFRKTVTNIVYQTCVGLMEKKQRRGWEGEEPILVRDDERRYRLNPKAKKAA